MFASTTDWALKRFLKFVLKRNIGRYLVSELDLEQLDVELGTGRLEMRAVLLNTDALNRDLVRASGGGRCRGGGCGPGWWSWWCAAGRVRRGTPPPRLGVARAQGHAPAAAAYTQLIVCLGW